MQVSVYETFNVTSRRLKGVIVKEKANVPTKDEVICRAVGTHGLVVNFGGRFIDKIKKEA